MTTHLRKLYSRMTNCCDKDLDVLPMGDKLSSLESDVDCHGVESIEGDRMNVLEKEHNGVKGFIFEIKNRDHPDLNAWVHMADHHAKEMACNILFGHTNYREIERELAFGRTFTRHILRLEDEQPICQHPDDSTDFVRLDHTPAPRPDDQVQCRECMTVLSRWYGLDD